MFLVRLLLHTFGRIFEYSLFSFIFPFLILSNYHLLIFSISALYLYFILILLTYLYIRHFHLLIYLLFPTINLLIFPSFLFFNRTLSASHSPPSLSSRSAYPSPWYPPLNYWWFPYSHLSINFNYPLLYMSSMWLREYRPSCQSQS